MAPLQTPNPADLVLAAEFITVGIIMTRFGPVVQNRSLRPIEQRQMPHA